MQDLFLNIFIIAKMQKNDNIFYMTGEMYFHVAVVYANTISWIFVAILRGI